jgi:hypothetical protein
MFNEQQSKSEKKPVSDSAKGIAYTFGLHLILAAILSLIFVIQGATEGGIYAPLSLIGITQWVYIIPVVVIVRGKGRAELAKGLLIGAAITFLLNAACAGITLYAVFSSHY